MAGSSARLPTVGCSCSAATLAYSRTYVRSSSTRITESSSGSIVSSSLPWSQHRCQVRTLIVPRQLKAYGGTFSQSIGERVDHAASHQVLQSLSPSRAAQSPLLAKPVKTKMVDNFADMLVTPALQEALADMGVSTPSPIQQTAIEAVLQRKNTVIAAPHGEGKTLAYLLPLYQNMEKDRDVYKIPLRERRPRMILLAPTKELVEQLQTVCARLDAATGLTSVCFTSRKRSKYHLSRMLKNTMADVLVMDPKLILRLLRTRRLFIEDLRYFAVDEADAMMSSLHDHDAVQLLMKVQKRNQFKYLWPVQTQYVFVTAYMTRKLEYIVGRKISDPVTCMFRQQMHRPQARLRHRFYAIRREPEKFTVLMHLLRKNGHVPLPMDTDVAEVDVHTNPRKLSGSLAEWHEAVQRCAWKEQQEQEKNSGSGEAVTDDVVDVDEVAVGAPEEASAAVPSARLSATENAAAGDDYDHDSYARYTLERVRPLHWEHLTTVAAPFTCPIRRTVFAEGRRTIVFFRNIDATTAVFYQLRSAGFAVSLLHASLPYTVRKEMYADFASGRTNILCATDLAARGLDLHVDMVINFDVPTNALAYLSRSGRTARMGREGQVLNLYNKHQGVIVSAIKAFLKDNLPMEGLTNRKADMMQPRYAEWRTHKINALARSYVSLITRKTIPAHLERTYVHHNATWRPVFHPQKTGIHGGVAPRQQQKLMDRVREQAVWFRRGQLARRKGGRAKFGSRTMKRGVWNDIGGVASREVVNEAQNPSPAGPNFGPPSGPPQ
ncbi:DEAD/DEAH box helicase-like protein [Leishmania donovani]|uniref:DEAD/DEAH box helicase family protein n=1 Tax=Leishmania donovani TaxID=5661 RepID=A0A3S7WQS0_LEIDO|nr:DEAD/DEAH box helicase-like protein [Leishmania donovani]AYU76528.1 DEAD/DEAH box helicase-like protein [Leishmania donovani]TPP41697.1 DEAD/DEAH box helicase family protein [Leishmania donovani]CBZ32048.1 DEAD/DEAH box helicase-like protein [Leishmania donovani]